MCGLLRTASVGAGGEREEVEEEERNAEKQKVRRDQSEKEGGKEERKEGRLRCIITKWALNNGERKVQ